VADNKVLVEVLEIWKALYHVCDEDIEKTHWWVQKPQLGLGGKTILVELETEHGRDRVKELINKLNHGLTA